MWTHIVSSCTFQTLVTAIVLCDLQVQSFKGVNQMGKMEPAARYQPIKVRIPVSYLRFKVT